MARWRHLLGEPEPVEIDEATRKNDHSEIPIEGDGSYRVGQAIHTRSMEPMTRECQLTRTKAGATPAPPFVPARTGILQRKCACGGAPGLDGECGECRKNRLTLQRRAANQVEFSTVLPVVNEVLRSPGEPLKPATRTFMEPRFGHDFGRVRVHTNARAAESAEAVGALAYTVGEDVVFGTGQYAPEIGEGRRLLAHELTHVVQQRASSSSRSDLAIDNPGDSYESQAGSAARSITGQGAYTPSRTTIRGLGSAADAVSPLFISRGNLLIQRQPDPAEAARIAKLKADYKAAVQAKDWDNAALLLNAFNDGDILTRLENLSTDELRLIHAAALKVMPGWSDRVHLPIEKLLAEADRVATLKANYEAAVQAEDWEKAAILLNGFSDADILVRLKRLSTDHLRRIDEAALKAMPGWSDRVHRPIAKLLLASADPNDPSFNAPGAAPRAASLGSFAPPTAEEMAAKPDDSRKKWQKWLDTRDDTARSFGAADYEDYVRNILVSGGSVFGKQVPADHPVHPLFLDRLEAASNKARAAIGSGDFGIQGFGGQGNRPGNHALGIAIDIDSGANPYIINESGEKALDALIEPVYERIARALLHRASVLTSSAPGKPSKLESATYAQVAEESDAMVAYFSVLSTPDSSASDPTPGKKTPPSRPLLPPRKLTSRQFDTADLEKLDRAQVQADYDLLIGKRVVEMVDGVPTQVGIDKVWRKKHGVTGDFPFAGAGEERDPRRGFLSIREEVVEALRSEGLRWGATDFPGASGDVMHFDDGNRHADYVQYGGKNPTEKRKKQMVGDG